MGRAYGKASIYIDGKLVRTVDQYAAATKFKTSRLVGNLTDARHTLRVVVLGQHRKASRGTMIAVDGFKIG
jgi:hypothetical protein